jgi:predicted nucleotidyltransferase component of viral defense system
VLTRYAITQRADADGVDAAVVERDYILAHVVAQLNRAVPQDGGRLVFKGGTALRFVHIAEYRYSADLDFTVIKGSAGPAVAAIADALAAARQHAELPHLQLIGADAPAIGYIGPLRAGKPRHIKLDVTADELVESTEQRIIQDIWSDLPSPVAFAVYPLGEIGAEKLRCIVQRVQCRDLYDLFRLTEHMSVSLAEIRPLFERKAPACQLLAGSSYLPRLGSG